MFADDWKYNDKGNLLQGEIQQPLVQIDHSHFCSPDHSGNLLEEEENFVQNSEISEERSNLEADSGADNPVVRQQHAL